MTDKQIIALGGGGFSMEKAPFLDNYILRASGKEKPRICFVPTACGDTDSYIVRFYRRFASIGCQATDLQLFRREIGDLEDYACSQDIIYVGGGNTANMLAIWREHGFDKALYAALSSGTILTGLSAGSICWFQHGITDSFGLDFKPLDCLGFLSGSNCPHYDGEPERRPAYHQAVSNGMPGGYATEDGVALHFINGELHNIVSSRPEAKCYKIEMVGSKVLETSLFPNFLGQN
jgi:dipeptidase E